MSRILIFKKYALVLVCFNLLWAPVLRAGGIKPGVSWKWPKNEVPYVFDANIDQYNNKQKFLEAIQYIQNNTAIRFRPKQVQDEDYIYLIGASYAQAEGIGREGGQQKVWAGTVESAVHELAHILGLVHEHQRSDREENVHYRKECLTNPNYDNNFNPNDGIPLEPYDLSSAMHYDAYYLACAGCYPGCPVLANPQNTGPIELIDRPEGEHLSIHDKNALIRMYPWIGGADEKDDRFATSLAQGDFDGDGYDDLAVGVPYENFEVDPVRADAGRAVIYKGTHSEVLRSRAELLQSPYSTNKAGDRFGEALAVGDFNGDGYDDLAVGVPGKDAGNTADLGAIHIAYGSSRHLGAVNLALNPLNFAIDDLCPQEFGKTLATADFDKDGRDDLVAGCRGGNAFIFKGQANKTFTYQGDLIDPSKYIPNIDPSKTKLKTIAVSPESFVPNNLGAFPKFALGYEVKFLNDNSPRGVVLRFKNNSQGDSIDFTFLQAIKSPAFGDCFGCSLTMMSKGSQLYLVVGAPQTDWMKMWFLISDAGMVYLYQDLNEPSASPVLLQKINSETFGFDSEMGDEFGSALHAFSGFNSAEGDWLAIGARGTNPLFSFQQSMNDSLCNEGDEGCGSGGGGSFIANNAGAVYLFQPFAAANSLPMKYRLTQNREEESYETTFNNFKRTTKILATRDPSGTSLSPLDNEFLGSSIISRQDQDGQSHLLVGAPGSSGSHGGRVIEYDLDLRLINETSFITPYRYRQGTLWNTLD